MRVFLLIVFVLIGCDSICRYEGMKWVEWEKYDQDMIKGNYLRSCLYTKVAANEYLFNCIYNKVE